MNKLCVISVISTMESAVRKLKKARICVYNCKKEGAAFIFSVKDKDIEKVFAIFAKPCYNIKVLKKSFKRGITDFLNLRAGLVAGAALFIAAIWFANACVLKIEISGNGKYLEPEVRNIVVSEGAGEFKFYSSFNKSVATGRILSLPQVTFCNIEKRGSVLVVDVRVDEEHRGNTTFEALTSDVDGTVKKVVAVCGTAVVAEGDAVRKGDPIICPYAVAGDKTVDCIAAGYAELECSATREYFAECESEENLQNAYASLLLEDDRIISRRADVKPTDGGVIYVIEYNYLHKLSINII